MISALLAAGVFLSVPIVGAIVTRPIRRTMAWTSSTPVILAAGLTLWSVPLLGSAALGIYRPEVLGAAGWVIGLWWAVRRGGWPRIRTPRPWTIVLIAGLIGAFVVYAWLPADPFTTGRDMAVYASHAAWIADHGRLDVPYAPGVLDASGSLPGGWVGLAGVYPTMPTQTVQFGHLYPTWLAQAYALGGVDALLRVNAVLAVIAALAFFHLARRWTPPSIAVLATLVLAYNASQVWVARNTLTETMTQFFIWCAFALLLRRAPASRAHLLWGGAFVGMAAVVRIDALVMVPLFIGGWALAATRQSSAPLHRPSMLFLATALPISAVAIACYAVLTTPYFNDLGSQLRLIGYAGVAAAAVYVLTFIPGVRAMVGRLMGATPFLAAAAVGTLALAAFGYFIRPNLEPLQLMELPGHPLDGTRSHVEDAMRNLGAYLGPPTVWLAIFGWVGMMIVAIRRRPLWLPVLVVIGGFSALYFWNPSIFPDHFWAIRRFVPLVIPAAVLLVSWAGWRLLLRFPRVIRPVLLTLAALALAAQTWRAGTPLFFVAERDGSHDVIEAVVSRTPDEGMPIGVFTADGMRGYGTPLALVFDRHIPAVDAWRPEGRAEILDRLEAATPSAPVTVFTNLPDDIAVLEGDDLASASTAYEVVVATTEPVPSQTRRSTLRFVSRAVTGVNTLGVTLGGRRTWITDDSGFHGEEPMAPGVARWTTESAEVRIPVLGGTAHRVRLDLVAAAPGGSQLTVLANGEQIGEIEVPEDGWSGELALPEPVDPGTDLELELLSSTFTPSELIDGSTDERELGVMLRGITLLGPAGG